MVLGRVLTRLGLVPTADGVGQIPMAKRLAMKSPGWAVPRPQSGVRAEDRTVPGRHGDIPVRIYRPERGPVAPVALLYIHGGGWTIGGLDSLDWFCREICYRGNHVVVSVQYRLAPDFPYPVPLDDVEDALTWLTKSLEEFGALETAVAGDSAGGNLAAAVSHRALTNGGPPVRYQVLLYPGLDATLSAPSASDTGSGLSPKDMAAAYDYYRGDADPRNPEISPLFVTDKTGLPQTLVITAEYDPLRDDGRLYAEALRAAGVPAQCIQYTGVDHGYLSLPRLTKQASRETTSAVLQALGPKQ
jgi:acetyl esterase